MKARYFKFKGRDYPVKFTINSLMKIEQEFDGVPVITAAETMANSMRSFAIFASNALIAGGASQDDVDEILNSDEVNMDAFRNGVFEAYVAAMFGETRLEEAAEKAAELSKTEKKAK